MRRPASYSQRGALSSIKDLRSYRPRDCPFETKARKRQRLQAQGFPGASMLSDREMKASTGETTKRFQCPSLSSAARRDVSRPPEAQLMTPEACPASLDLHSEIRSNLDGRS